MWLYKIYNLHLVIQHRLEQYPTQHSSELYDSPWPLKFSRGELSKALLHIKYIFLGKCLLGGLDSTKGISEVTES